MRLVYENIFWVPALVGVIFIIAGLLTKKFPPKNINQIYGYRTSRSMKNQATWDFAQQYSSVVMIKLGIVLLLASLLNLIFKFSIEYSVLIGLGIMLIGIIAMMIQIENAIKEKFRN